ncbi:MAG: hypothetical protein A2788_01330 [Candidatus Abawacabacteria bacterium RIFCSPHIGHO2_01_FULL_46_8]|uniref:Ribbon-helix-helix protein CopG domain-containing protein n=1 Tax=Candidatus Abawacabacteria bacterium RIFCSPHIGHO2_01_FULL_46_8 TaxID=1817815 RepID=A0A1F4XME2_9BACT|nr:MAG: hypothetical protein A2788_01330 [Candidatus Abawacabacteria bacterium RIFCSPHIGHO2_01_FULL_46_8]
MTTISFKAEDKLKQALNALAKKQGINTSAYIKLILTKEINSKLAEITENGLTVAEELSILVSDSMDEVSGPFKTVASLMRALKKK